MVELLKKYISGKKVVVLGFGKEGRSTYNLLRKYFPETDIAIADKNTELDISDVVDAGIAKFITGDNYLDQIADYDIIFKSPGVSIDVVGIEKEVKQILTQTSLFLENYSSQIIGVTGTKGKSTTASLIHHIFKTARRKSVLIGNIGVPPFEAIDEIDDDSSIVFELSAHQLEQARHSPKISILLNVFNEHLDYFKSFGSYGESKLKIARFQNPEDHFIFSKVDLQKFEEKIELFKGSKFRFSSTSSSEVEAYYNEGKILSVLTGGTSIGVRERMLIGEHNLKNILAATAACLLSRILPQDIEKGIITFQPLEHRLEFVGAFCGIDFINDSISTIPESTIEALNTIKNVDTLILGGFDRGIDYTLLTDYLSEHPIKNIFYTGPAGLRMNDMLRAGVGAKCQTSYFENYNELANLILKLTTRGKVCLLSPAASSYDQFNNFEERGSTFKKIARLLGESCH